MTDDIVKKCNRRKRIIPFCSGKPRQRSACPDCESVSISMRSTTRDYVCDRCGWVGKSVIKIEY